MSSTDVSFERTVFTAPRSRLERFTNAIAEQLPRDRAVRVLDVGCGTGAQLFDLARALPLATGVGVDVSEESIRVAEAGRARQPGGERLRFVARDYLALEEPAFDAIVSYSVLYVVPGTTEALVAKLARDLVPGGVLVNCMADASLSNRLLVLARRVLRLLRGRLLERLALAVASRLYKDLSRELLLERIPYLYVIPERLEGARFQAAAKAAGLEVVLERKEPRTSLAELGHRLVVYRKKG